MWSLWSNRRHTKVALVLSGGGFLGSAQVGCLEVLVRAGFRPDLIVGTSVGALNGAFFAAHPDADGLAELRSMWAQADPTRVFGGMSIPVLLRVVAGRDHLFSNRELLRVLVPWAESRTFSDLDIPMHAVAMELTTGSRAVFSTGPLLPGLVASAAVPGMLPPVEIDGKQYADGAAVGHASVETAYEQGADIAVVMHIPHVLVPSGYGPVRSMAVAARSAINRACDLEQALYGTRMTVFRLELPCSSPEDSRTTPAPDQIIMQAAQWTEEFLATPEGVKLLTVAGSARTLAQSP